MVGKNKSEFPQQITNKEVYRSSFSFTNDTSVVNKPNKISTLHDDNKASERNDLKPQIILDYNVTKDYVELDEEEIQSQTHDHFFQYARHFGLECVCFEDCYESKLELQQTYNISQEPINPGKK